MDKSKHPKTPNSEVITYNTPLVGQESIENYILTIRGKQVMLDRDLAVLYGEETRRLNEQVKRNIERFPSDFMFQLSSEEFTNWKSQFATSNSIIMGARKRPYAFTEQGIAMLSSVLRSTTAIEVNIRIMRAFTAVRQFVSTNVQMFNRIEALEHHQLILSGRIEQHNKQLDEVFRKIDEKEERRKQGIFFDGQIYDAYTFVCDLIRSAKTSIILIDNYIDDSVLTLLDKRKNGVNAQIYTARITDSLKLDIDRHNAQYSQIDVQIFLHSHDRFLCVDNTVYHIGASIKDLGKKWFAFSILEDTRPIDLLKKINQ